MDGAHGTNPAHNGVECAHKDHAYLQIIGANRGSKLSVLSKTSPPEGYKANRTTAETPLEQVRLVNIDHRR